MTLFPNACNPLGLGQVKGRSQDLHQGLLHEGTQALEHNLQSPRCLYRKLHRQHRVWTL